MHITGRNLIDSYFIVLKRILEKSNIDSTCQTGDFIAVLQQGKKEIMSTLL